MLHIHVEKGKNNWHHVCHYQCLLKSLNVLSVQVGCRRPSTDKGQKLGKSVPHFFSQESTLVVCCTSFVISSVKDSFFRDLLCGWLHDLFMTGVHFWTIKSSALCWMFQVHMVLNWRASQNTMSDTSLSSIPGKVCSIPIYRSKETTMRFFIHSCTSCCSITTPRRPAGSHQALITLWLPCFCGRGIILSTLLQANAGRWGKGVGASANFQCPYVDMCIYKYYLLGGWFISARVFFPVWCHPWMDGSHDEKSFTKNDHDVLYYM
jgi:hypothetical protein